MPPKRKAPAASTEPPASTAPTNPLQGLVFVISGTLTQPRAKIEASIKAAGGQVSKTVTAKVTHLLTTFTDYNSGTNDKVVQTTAKGISCVSEAWLNTAIESGPAAAQGLTFGSAAASPAPAAAPAKAAGAKKAGKKTGAAKKAAAKPVEDEEDEEKDEAMDTEEPAPPAPSKKRKAGDAALDANDDRPFKRIKSKPSAKAPKVKCWKAHDSAQPYFGQVQVLEHIVLQMTDIGNNNNKYYSLELQQGDEQHRLYSHYGRTCDLDVNPNAGQRETRYFDSVEDAQAGYLQLIKEKEKKGYKPIKLAASNIGSDEAKLLAASETAATKATAGKPKKAAAPKTSAPSTLHKAVQELVSYIYSEASNHLTSNVSATITEDGISTPLGVLTLDQVEKGEEILGEIHKEISKPSKKSNGEILSQLSSNFYSTIPHHIGRSAQERKAAIITDLDGYKAKMDLIQLMKDMLNVNEKDNVLYDEDVDNRYKALGISIEHVDPKSDEYAKTLAYVANTMDRETRETYNEDKANGIKEDEAGEALDAIGQVINIFKLSRPSELSRFNSKIGNQQLLYHGSRIQNWVGLLSRGILMPSAVTALGVPRTDFGWLGAGIYFGDCLETSAQYAHPGKKGTSLICLCNVALGKIFDQTQQDGKITAPPKGFDSMHGDPEADETEFDDHEFCVYNDNQQHMSYLLEVAI